MAPWTVVLLLVVVVLNSCGYNAAARSGAAPVVLADDSPPVEQTSGRLIRATGTTQALKALSVRVPPISGQSSRVTLTGLIPNGSKVNEGDVLAEFDLTTLIDEERESVAKLADLTHQIEERVAKTRSDSAKRVSAIREAEADVARAQIQLRKGPILSEIERLKNEIREQSSRARVESLTKSHAFREAEEKASVRVLELKRDRQQVALDRTRRNMERLAVKAPHAGMIALENIWRNGSQGPPQEGDQMYAGNPVLRIFDPSRMVVDAVVNEPDIAALAAGTVAKIYLDAYPDAVFDARLESAAPVATAGLDTPVRTFSARFRIDQQDPRLLPDLSVSLEINIPYQKP